LLIGGIIGDAHLAGSVRCNMQWVSIRQGGECEHDEMIKTYLLDLLVSCCFRTNICFVMSFVSSLKN
jgi:hypothetical protein